MKKNYSYTAKDIEILDGLKPVRKRPGMFIGNTNEEGLHHLVNEVLDNAIDEVLSGHAKNIIFYYSKDNFITIKDDGRGIPIEFHPKYKNKRALEIVLTTLHAGGKFNHKIYQTSGGLHGVGISVVNALSSNLEVKVYKNSKVYYQTYKQGIPTAKIKTKKCSKNLKGTEVKFKPDQSIFENIFFSPEKLFFFIKNKAFLAKGTKQDKSKTDEFSELIKNLASLNQLNWIEGNKKKPPSAISVYKSLEILIPLEGLIDPNEERLRVKKNVAKLEKENQSLNNQLENRRFLTNAPQDLVKSQKKRAKEIVKEKRGLILHLKEVEKLT